MLARSLLKDITNEIRCAQLNSQRLPLYCTALQDTPLLSLLAHLACSPLSCLLPLDCQNNFPVSRWEVFDPSIVRDKYTIHGQEVRGPSAKK